MPSKSTFKSKTFWFNVLGGIAVLASGQMGITIPHAPEVMAVTNVLLRFATTQPVHLVAPPQ